MTMERMKQRMQDGRGRVGGNGRGFRAGSNAARVLPGNRAMMKQALLEEVLMIIFSELGLMPLAEKTDCREWID